HLWSASRFVSAGEIKDRLATEFTLNRVSEVYGGGPARYYQIPGGKGTIGFITAMSQHFCQFCNRVRLTADGKINPCLASPLEVDLATPMRSGASDGELRELIRMAVLIKPAEHHLESDAQVTLRQMSKIGG
ncbi:MAG: GTP 3',8-cyclase MoaA, partial [Firmicutes bacterium]|nr:GTP 3',8-cyclase MoaA [Bacillota bacterium]